MNQLTITIEENGRKGRYVGRFEGSELETEITFTHRGPNKISADHTGVPEEWRGTGAAATLVDYMIADAHQRGFKIIPVCAYVKARYRTHPEWQDVMTIAHSENGNEK